jgi:outer membrane lipoprotein-sorting protein
MLIRKALIGLLALCYLGSGVVLAETAVKPKKPVKTATAAAGVSAQEAVERANAYFNAAQTMVANFVQIGADGGRSEGEVYVQKPGRLRFDYDPPARIQITADGTSLAIKDVKLAKQDLYFISQTPLKFLLQDRIDLATDTKVLGVTSDASTTSIQLEDSATFGGTSHITLIFDTSTFQLRQWVVADPQGFETTVSLFNADFNTRPDPSLFVIDERLGGTKK